MQNVICYLITQFDHVGTSQVFRWPLFCLGLVFELPHQKCFSHLSNKLFIDLATKHFHAQSNLFTNKCYRWYLSLQPHLTLKPTFQNLAILLLILKLTVLYCHFFHCSTWNETMWCNTRFIGLCWDWNKSKNPFIPYDACLHLPPYKIVPLICFLVLNIMGIKSGRTKQMNTGKSIKVTAPKWSLKSKVMYLEYLRVHK